MMKEEEATEFKTTIATTKTKGKYLNQFLLYATYIVVFIILAIFLMLSFFSIEDKVVVGNIWPFLFFIVVLIFCCLVIVERVKTESKQTVQRDMRRL